MKQLNTNHIFSLLIIGIFVISPVGLVNGMQVISGNESNISPLSSQLDNLQLDSDSEGAQIQDYPDLNNPGNILPDNENSYKQVWDPWLTKAAIHAVASTDDGNIMAVGGGYLYGEEIRVYRWNLDLQRYDFVDKFGANVIDSDVLELEFADTDYNNLTELIVGTEQGQLMVFEQTAIYDPNTNLETNFDLVYQSGYIGRIFDLTIADTDKDSRKDIIVGAGNEISWFEYDTHGSYPFDTDHYIDYRKVFSYSVSSPITALSVSDADQDGLQEVAAGQRSGQIDIIENNGTLLDIEGTDYPIYQDNSYTKIASTNSTIRRAITDMSASDFDDDGYQELLVAAQGQGAYILDQFGSEIGLFQLHRPFDSWESDETAPFPLDYYSDFIVDSSSLIDKSTYTYTSDPNVYFDNSGSQYAEPLNDSSAVLFPFINPYRSASVQEEDEYQTTFDGTDSPAWMIYDMGKDEEASSNGIKSIPDVAITSTTFLSPSNLEVSISQDGETFVPLEFGAIPYGFGKYQFDVDKVLEQQQWTYWQYMKINVSGAIFRSDSIETYSVNQPIYDALSTEVGQIDLKSSTRQDAGYIATIDGALLGIGYNETTSQYQILWDSYKDDRYSLGDNVFDLELIKKGTRFPGWLYSDNNYQLNLDAVALPDGGSVIDYAAANIYDYKGGRGNEFVVISSKLNIYVYRQSGPNAVPQLDTNLGTELFADSTDDTSINGIQSKLNSLKSSYNQSSVSLVPVKSVVQQPSEIQNGDRISPIDNAYWLFLGQWNASLGLSGEGNYREPGSVDLSVYYLELSDNTGNCGELVECTVFRPLIQDTTISAAKLATNLEETGQLTDILRDSDTLPHLAGADMVGNGLQDLVLANGKLHLLANSFSTPVGTNLNTTLTTTEQELVDQGLITNKAYSKVNYQYVSGYFDMINEMSNGRNWERAEIVNFDGDDDFDLILTPASYNTAFFGFDKPTFGMTYWENQGTAQDPLWVERKKAVTNTDPDSNFRAFRFGRAELIYNNYEFEKYDSLFGYHPLFRSDLPSQLVMFQAESNSDIYTGKLQAFTADYGSDAAFLAATYPEAKRLDVNLQYLNTTGDTEINFGYHVVETWDNAADLDQWTLSMDVADMDEDGNNEIVVGDFSNKVYLFEHLTNNTFKRSFNTFNANYTSQLQESPYAHEDFAGLSGSFTRRVYNHFKYIIAGVDLNQNGLQEFVGVTEKQVLIFEAKETAIGNIQDDSYVFKKLIDIRSIEQLTGLKGDLLISAIEAGSDFTDDGRGELLIGIQSALLILEFDQNFTYEEVFQGPYEKGIYNIPGNYHLWPNHFISNIVVDDVTDSGFDNVIIGGTDKRNAKSIWSGFVQVLRWQNSTFQIVASQDDFGETTEYNPVTSLTTSDQDLDLQSELLIGTTTGIDIYEAQSGSFSLQEQISGDPSHYDPQREYFVAGLGDYERMTGEKAVIEAGATLKMVFATINEDPKLTNYEHNIYQATSSDNGVTWTIDGEIEYAPTDSPSGSVVSIEGIDLYEDSYENIWLSFVEIYHNSATGDSYTAHYVIDDITPGVDLDTAYLVYYGQDNSRQRVTPRLFDLPNTPTDIIGLGVNWRYSGSNGLALLRVNTSISSTVHYDGGHWYDYANNTQIPEHYQIHSLDIEESRTNNSVKTLVFSGMTYSKERSMDWDLYTSTLMVMNTSISDFRINTTRPTGIEDSAYQTINPSLVETVDGSLLLTYEQEVNRQFGGIKMIWSSNKGTSWHGPYEMGHQLGLDLDMMTTYSHSNGLSYSVGTKVEKIMLKDFQSLRPNLVSLSSGGYSLQTTITYGYETEDYGPCTSTATNYFDQDLRQDLGQVFNEAIKCTILDGSVTIESVIDQDGLFTQYPINRVYDIATGDTDQDSREEILINTGSEAVLFEYVSNSQTSQQHQYKWTSSHYDRGITSIAIAETNGDIYEEILIEGRRGIIHSYEIINKQPDNPLLIPQTVGSVTTTQQDENGIRKIIEFDINDDGTLDLIYSTAFGDVVALDGTDYGILWQASRASGGEMTYNPSIALAGIDTNSPLIVQAHRDLLRIVNSSDGSILDIENYPFNITAFEVGTLTSATYPQVVTALDDGSFWAYDVTTSGLVYTWDNQINSFGSSEIITSIDISRFHPGSQGSVILTTDDDYIALYSAIGEQEWDEVYPVNPSVPNQGIYDSTLLLGFDNTTVAGTSILDINQDGFSDIVYGSNITYAIDGMSGSQLWNYTLPTSTYLASKQPELVDINQDGFKDIIYSTFNYENYSDNQSQDTSLIAIDGDTGNRLWSFQDSFGKRSVLADYTSQGVFDILPNTNLLAASMFDFTPYLYFVGFTGYSGVTPGSNMTVLHNVETGQPVGMISTNSWTRANAIHERPTEDRLVVGTHDGRIMTYSFDKVKSQAALNGSVFAGLSETANLEWDMTDATGSLVEDIDSDGNDDLIMVSADDIIAYSGNNLTNGEINTLWKQQLSYGEFTGEYELVDLVGDVKNELVVAFEDALVAFNFESGIPIWVKEDITTTPIDTTFALNILDHEFEVISTSDGPKIIWSVDSEFDAFPGSYWVQFYFLDGATGAEYDLQEGNGRYSSISAGDVDDDGRPEIVASLVEIYDNPASSYLLVIDDYQTSHSVSYSQSIQHIGPITEIHTGEFNSTISGDEIALMVEFSLLEPSFGTDFRNHPTEFVLAAYNTTAPSSERLITPNKPTHTGIAYDPNSTLLGLSDISGDGLDDLVLQSDYGYATITTKQQNGRQFTMTDPLTIASVPYGFSQALISDYCGIDSLLVIDTSQTLSCYDNLNFTAATQQSQVKINSIPHTILEGDFDGDASLEVMVIGMDSGVYFLEAVDLQNKGDEVLEQQNESSSITTYIVTGVGIATVLIILAHQMGYIRIERPSYWLQKIKIYIQTKKSN